MLCDNGFTGPTSTAGARLWPKIEIMDPGATAELGVWPTLFETAGRRDDREP